MKLLTRLALGGFDGSRSSLVRRGGSLIGLRRSMHLLISCLGQPRAPSDQSPASTAAAKDPSWALLKCGDCRRVDSIAADDDKTVAESRTSTAQHRLRVSFRLAAPPAISSLCYDYAGTVPEGEEDTHTLAVIAAHGDSIVLRLRRMPRRRGLVLDGRGRLVPPTFDHFVYRAGSAARPPSLSLLPDLTIPRKHYGHHRFLLDEDTGVLRRGDDELLAQLNTGHHDDRLDMADLCVLRLGGTSQQPDWELRAVPILHEEGDELMGLLTGPEMAVPVGDNFLCWVAYHNGFVLGDMADAASPRLRHVRLPVYYYDQSYSYYTNDLPPLRDPMGLGAAGPGAVRFVAVEPRCCCGRRGRCSCARARFAFTVTTWTLTLTMDEPIEWVKDGVLDCEELWAMAGYEGLPRVHLESPVVSLENPDVVCFKVGRGRTGGEKAWMIQVDTRRKTLLAADQLCSAPES